MTPPLAWMMRLSSCLTVSCFFLAGNVHDNISVVHYDQTIGYAKGDQHSEHPKTCCIQATWSAY